MRDMIDRRNPSTLVLHFAVPALLPAELAHHRLSSARVVAIIPARFGASRFPGKPLADIAGRPMIAHVLERAAQATLVDAVIVATDDLRVADAVERAGGLAVMTRDDHATGTDRLAEVAAHLNAVLVVNVQGDEPLIEPDAIDAAVAPLLANDADVMGTLRKRIDRSDDLQTPGIVKLVIDREGYALYFSRATIPFVRPGEAPPVMWRHLGLYVYRRPFLLTLAGLPQTPAERAEGLEQLRALEHGYRIRTVETTVATVEVNTPEDLERVRRLVDAGVRMRG
jgi:3-deoxy-manno-octulosonate cytidylyltransferase (CMP-KDO synthetase)